MRRTILVFLALLALLAIPLALPVQAEDPPLLDGLYSHRLAPQAFRCGRTTDAR